MVKSDFKEGEYYTWRDHGIVMLIILYNNTTRYKDDDRRIAGVSLTDRCTTYNHISGGLYFLERDVKPATEEEKIHLNACIKANKWISFKDAIKEYIHEQTKQLPIFN